MNALLLLLLACGGTRPGAAPPPEDAPSVVVTVPPAARGASKTPAGDCTQRVEGREQDGECVTDADCARAGCSQEVCVPAKAAGEVVTTCEILPCFATLDSCGCHEGRCSWTYKEPALQKFPVPPPAPPKP